MFEFLLFLFFAVSRFIWYELHFPRPFGNRVSPKIQVKASYSHSGLVTVVFAFYFNDGSGLGKIGSSQF